MSIDLDKMTVEEWAALNQRIVERLKFLESVQAYQEMMAFNRGARVSFEVPGEGRPLAPLVQFNRKTVTVMTDRGQRWTHRISYHWSKRPRPDPPSSMPERKGRNSPPARSTRPSPSSPHPWLAHCPSRR